MVLTVGDVTLPLYTVSQPTIAENLVPLVGPGIDGEGSCRVGEGNFHAMRVARDQDDVQCNGCSNKVHVKGQESELAVVGQTQIRDN